MFSDPDELFDIPDFTNGDKKLYFIFNVDIHRVCDALVIQNNEQVGTS